MRIGIEVNGVLRNTLGKLEQVYQKFMIDKTDGIDEVLDFKYEMTLPVTSTNLMDHFAFQSDEELYSFLYEEFPMEIFGHAGSVETMSLNDFNNFYIEFRDKHDIIIVSDEMGKSKPATLFFLSKFGCLTENIKFYSNITINSLWEDVDILLTANPNILLTYPKNKIIIKYKTIYNEDIQCDNEIQTIKELPNKIKKIEQDAENF